jgi:hypothetical protein
MDGTAVPDLYAWVGEDELGSGQVGIKQGDVPAGRIPLVSMEVLKLTREPLLTQLQLQARLYGKHIRLVRFVAVEEVHTIEPKLT